MAKTLVLKKLSKIKPEPTKWYWQDYIPAGAITILEGDPGLGKSTVLASLVACTTKRRKMPGSNKRAGSGTALCLSSEDNPTTIRANLKANGADLNRVFVLGSSDYSQITLPSGIDRLKEWIREKKAKVVILDPAMAFISGSANDANSVRKALTPLTAVAAETGAAIVLVRHLTKAGGKNALHQGAGSTAWSAAARAVLQVVDDSTSKLIDPNNSTRVLIPIKSSLGPLAQALSFCLVSADDGGVKVEWRGPSNYQVDQGRDAHLGPARLEACEFLWRLLTPGPLHAVEVHRLGRENGVSKSTLERATLDLGLKKVRHEFGPGGWSTWELPESNPLIDRFNADAADELAELKTDTDPEDKPDADDGGSALLARAGIHTPTSAEIDSIEESMLAV